MKAIRFTFIVFFMLSQTSWARHADPGALIDGSKSAELSGSQAGSQAGSWRDLSVKDLNWNKVKSTVQVWWANRESKKSDERGPASQAQQAARTEAPKTSDEVTALVESLPAVNTQDAASTPLVEMEKAAPQIRQIEITKSTPGIAPDPSLSLNKAGVPTFALTTAKKIKTKDGKSKTIQIPKTSIPALGVGEEPRVVKSDFTLPDVKFMLASLGKATALPTPKIMAKADLDLVTKKKRDLAGEPKAPTDLLKGVGKPVTEESVASIVYQISEDQAVTEQAYKPFSVAELQMLAALILVKNGEQCPIAVGLFDRVARNKELTTEANFHLGSCAMKLKLYAPAFERLSSVIKTEEAEYASPAIGILAKDLPSEYEVSFSKLVRGIKNKSLLIESDQQRVSYLVAKGAFKAGQFGPAKTAAREVKESSPDYASAQFVLASAEHLSKEQKNAVKTLESLRAWIEKTGKRDKNIESLSALNLARMYFSANQHQKALELYMKIDKEHPTWVQALVEMGWIQLAVDDFAGAIGNMYSLHSPYFKSVYKPESFVVRTIGYLNICQYADAYKTLTWLESEHRPWLTKMQSYMSANKSNSAYYDTVRNYLRGKSTEEVDGLPFQVIREMARQRDFLNVQTSLNQKEDELGRYPSVVTAINQQKNRTRTRVQQAQERLSGLRANLKQSKVDGQNAQFLQQWRGQARLEEEIIAAHRYHLEMLEVSRQGYESFKSRTFALIEKERVGLRQQAGTALASSFKKMATEVGRVLENNEFLRYEVFAGSGENIRYQVGGGATDKTHRIPASIKPQKMLNWDFDGEYWEDEIGSYRSTLRNNCPKLSQTKNEFKSIALTEGVGQ